MHSCSKPSPSGERKRHLLRFGADLFLDGLGNPPIAVAQPDSRASVHVDAFLPVSQCTPTTCNALSRFRIRVAPLGINLDRYCPPAWLG
jgi:hypothetical protein